MKTNLEEAKRIVKEYNLNSRNIERFMFDEVFSVTDDGDVMMLIIQLACKKK